MSVIKNAVVVLFFYNFIFYTPFGGGSKNYVTGGRWHKCFVAEAYVGIRVTGF